ncbi:LysE family translocator [Alkalimonas collagenimarina]|uniref:LysE family translocator n=1 Tax=Alkalimonas collagenimarina TaxID=400390 RepID=A0ABT9H2A2_9GAMM|nr:LysE family translocator [Alkalimonas collagenimarina]MDP4537447.1 LysE family translocator [Alkalimonas collagenimarina]
MNFWSEFFLIMVVHFMAVASPGPDFAIVLRYAVRYGKRAALSASIGIGLAILLHVTYSLVGIGLLIKTTPWLYMAFSVVAALYLVFLGMQALRSKAPDVKEAMEHEQVESSLSSRKAMLTGFITNGLNPKATLFFLSLFAVVISVNTPFHYKLVYGIYMAIATAAWFSLLSLVLTRAKVRGFLLLKGYWFDRAMGLLLLALALHLIWGVF